MFGRKKIKEKAEERREYVEQRIEERREEFEERREQFENEFEKRLAERKQTVRNKIPLTALLIGAIYTLALGLVIVYTCFMGFIANKSEKVSLEGSAPYAIQMIADDVSSSISSGKGAESALSGVTYTENSELALVNSKTGAIVAGKAETLTDDMLDKVLENTNLSEVFKVKGTKYVAVSTTVSGTDMLLVDVTPVKDFGNKGVAGYIIGLAIFGVLFAAFGLFMALPKMVIPISILVPEVERIGKGDFSGEEQDVGDTYKDIRILVDGVYALKYNTNNVIEDIGYVLGEISNGNLSVEPKNESIYVGDYREIRNSLVQIKSRLSETMSDISLVSDEVLADSEQMSTSAQNLAQGATEQASSVEELSATTMEVSKQIKDSAEVAQRASVLTAESSAIMNDSLEAMKNAKDAMDEISDTSSNISKVIKAIDDIAFQTNILALNAAVEAARAGSAGKGFAVVADEVRNLSQKSAQAAKSSAVLIESSIEAVNKGNALVDKASTNFNLVSEKSAEVTAIVTQLSDNFTMQAKAVDQISVGVEQIASVTQVNSATSEETAAAAQELTDRANTLKDLVSQFQID